MIFVSETDQSLQLDVVATVGSDWEDPPLQPPGVTVSITRETEEKVRTYAQRGVLGVDMETSAMYAVGIFRGVEVCNLLTVSDELWGDWHPPFEAEHLEAAKVAKERAERAILATVKEVGMEAAPGGAER